MMRPAMIATPVSMPTVESASPVRLRSRPMREPKMAWPPMPTDSEKNA